MPAVRSKFPKDLADAVFARWDNLIAGEYVTPPCPSKKQLKEIVETAYLTASAPEEGRFPRFNIVVTPKASLESQIPGLATYRFEGFRDLSVAELRRLAPATDHRKSAIWIVWDEASLLIAGICDLGTSWHRARMGFAYSFRVPAALIVQLDRPGRMKIYQGSFAVGSLSDGELAISKTELQLFMHKSVGAGFEKLIEQFSIPEFEHPKDFEGFWWIALWNVFASIANSISASGQGGMLVIADDDQIVSSGELRIKYPIRSGELRSAFIDFVNARNVTADCWTRIELGHEGVEQDYRAELALVEASDRLVEAARLVSQFAGCDGAIVITNDLNVIGFGVEIRSEIAEGCLVEEVTFEFGDNGKACDLEQFGMRHRSAIKLASRSPETCILVASQDGPISGVWSKDGKVQVKKGVYLPNMNLPWS